MNKALRISTLRVLTTCLSLNLIVTMLWAQNASLPPATDPHLNSTYTTSSGTLHLVGFHTQARLTQAPFDEWYKAEHKSYSPNKQLVDQLRGLVTSEHYVTIVLGTWCGDSKREVPRLLKVLDAIGLPEGNITLLAVNNEKQDPEGQRHRFMDLHRVPLIIIYERQWELGRIVERPVVSLEEDLLTILKREPYATAYPGIAYLQHTLATKGISYCEEHYLQLAQELKDKLRNEYALRTWAWNLWRADYQRAGHLGFKLNDAVYPDDQAAAAWLAYAEFELGNEEAGYEILPGIDFLKDPEAWSINPIRAELISRWERTRE